MNNTYNIVNNLYFSQFKSACLSDGCHFVFDCKGYSDSLEAGINVYSIKSGNFIKKIPFAREIKIGNLLYSVVSDFDTVNWCYTFYCGETEIEDCRADRYINVPAYGKLDSNYVLRAAFDFNYASKAFSGYKHKYQDSFIYQLHVRGFSKHSSSMTKYKGCFKGVIDKIDHFKELGVTTLELQPVNEFRECDPKTERLNYWGYCEGLYYTPKQAYSCSDNSNSEFVMMVDELHKNGLEVILQMFFAKSISRREIVSILEYWTLKFGIDGFHILGENIPLQLIEESRILSDSKVWCDNLEGISDIRNSLYESADHRKFALYRDDFLYAIRHLLKGDEFSLAEAVAKLKNNPTDVGCINYLNSFNTMTLADMVSYDRKHNEDNGEDNKDGVEFNCSWNCGEEGPSRKQKVVALRKKQIKNALILLFMSAGTPMIYMGDEFLNSQKGNNNPYCIDSPITWLDWSALKKSKNIFELIKELASYRKEFSAFHKIGEPSMIDMTGCGFPELSYHGESAWKQQLESYRHSIGIMFCEKGRLLYYAINLHWNSERLSLPRPPKNQVWSLKMATDKIEVPDEELTVSVPERTIAIFETKFGVRETIGNTDKRGTKNKNNSKLNSESDIIKAEFIKNDTDKAEIIKTENTTKN